MVIKSVLLLHWLVERRERSKGSSKFWSSSDVWRSARPCSQQASMYFSLGSICSFPAFLLAYRGNGLPVLFLGFWLKHPVQRTVPCQLLDRLSTLSWHISSYEAPKGLHSQNPSILEAASTLSHQKNKKPNPKKKKAPKKTPQKNPNQKKPWQSRYLSALWWAITFLTQAPCHSIPAAVPQTTQTFQAFPLKKWSARHSCS